MKMIDKLKELFKPSKTREMSEEQVTKPKQEVKLVPNEKEINMGSPVNSCVYPYIIDSL